MLRALACFAALAVLTTAPAKAAPPLQILPVLIDLPANKPMGSVRLKNLSAEPVAFSAAAHAWSQVGGEDVLNDASDIIVSPPAFIVPPGGEQIVRIGASAPSGASERAYRLIFSQTLLNAPPSGQMQMRYELSLPLFVAPQKNVFKGLSVTQAPNADGARMVRVANDSNRHMRLADADIDGKALRLPRYLLAGSSVETPAPSPEVAALRVSFAEAAAYAPSPKIFSLTPDAPLRATP